MHSYHVLTAMAMAMEVMSLERHMEIIDNTVAIEMASKRPSGYVNIGIKMYYLPRINGNVNGSLERQMEIIDNTKTHGNGNGSYKSGKTNGSITRSQMEIIDNTKVKRRAVKEYVTCVARITPYDHHMIGYHLYHRYKLRTNQNHSC